MVGGVERLILDILSYFDKDQFDIKVITVLGRGPMESLFKNLGIPIYSAYPNNFSKKLSSKLYWVFVSLITLIRITFFLIKSKPDIIVSSLFQADVLGMTAAKIARIKNRVIVQHDIVKLNKIAFYIKKVFALNISTKIISVSNTVENYLTTYFNVELSKIDVINNGINYDAFKKGIKENNNFKKPVVGIIGRLEEVKGHKIFLNALNILNNNKFYPRILIAGSGSLNDSLKKFISDNQITNVELLGNISDVPSFLRKVDIVVVPSLDEGFGLVTLESMVSRKLIIASDIDATKEIVKNNYNGLLFASKNPVSLSNQLQKILQDKEGIIYKRIILNVIEFNNDNKTLYEIKNVSLRYQNLFKQMI